MLNISRDYTKCNEIFDTFVAFMAGIMILAIGACVCLGYNLLYFDINLPNGSDGQLLDIIDYISNYIMMPLVALFTCIINSIILTINRNHIK